MRWITRVRKHRTTMSFDTFQTGNMRRLVFDSEQTVWKPSRHAFQTDTPFKQAIFRTGWHTFRTGLRVDAKPPSSVKRPLVRTQ